MLELVVLKKYLKNPIHLPPLSSWVFFLIKHNLYFLSLDSQVVHHGRSLLWGLVPRLWCVFVAGEATIPQGQGHLLSFQAARETRLQYYHWNHQPKGEVDTMENHLNFELWEGFIATKLGWIYQNSRAREREASEDLIDTICDALRKNLAGDTINGYRYWEISKAVLDTEMKWAHLNAGTCMQKCGGRAGYIFPMPKC